MAGEKEREGGRERVKRTARGRDGKRERERGRGVGGRGSAGLL